MLSLSPRCEADRTLVGDRLGDLRASAARIVRTRSNHIMTPVALHEWIPMHPEGIGAPVRRREDLRFLVGQGQFVADLVLEGELACAFVRSPHAHARIDRIDTQAATAAPGVVAVYTGADMAADGVGPMAPLWRIPGASGTTMSDPPRWTLA